MSARRERVSDLVVTCAVASTITGIGAAILLDEISADGTVGAVLLITAGALQCLRSILVLATRFDNPRENGRHMWEAALLLSGGLFLFSTASIIVWSTQAAMLSPFSIAALAGGVALVVVAAVDLRSGKSGE